MLFLLWIHLRFLFIETSIKNVKILEYKKLFFKQMLEFFLSLYLSALSKSLVMHSVQYWSHQRLYRLLYFIVFDLTHKDFVIFVDKKYVQNSFPV